MLLVIPCGQPANCTIDSSVFLVVNFCHLVTKEMADESNKRNFWNLKKYIAISQGKKARSLPDFSVVNFCHLATSKRAGESNKRNFGI